MTQQPVREKLTKKFFMGLPKGVYLTSNTYKQNRKPIFADYVVAKGAAREAQWKSIKASGVDQNLCNVFKSSKEYKNFASKFMGIPNP
jgi:hypothetical protein